MQKSRRFRPNGRVSRQGGGVPLAVAISPALSAAAAAPLPAAVEAPPAPPGGEDARRAAMRAGFDALHAGRFAEARDHLLPFLDEDDIEASLLCGLALGACGQATEAAPLLNAVAKRRPQALHPCVDLMTLLQKQFRAASAEPTFRACIALSPDNPKLRLAFAQLLTDLHRLDEAMEEVERCLAALPDYVPALNQKGIIRIAQNHPDDGIGFFRRVVELDNENAAAWANIGCALTAENRFEEALAAYRRSIHRKPKDAQVRLNHSISLLKAGRMVQGWQEHEWRFQLPGHTKLPLDRLLSTLDADADLTGKRILLTHEEGIGDTLMFLRYVPLLARLGAHVIAWVPLPLLQTVARVEGIAGVRATQDIEFDCDFHCPFISLPRVFALRTADVWGAPVPYLRTDPERVALAAQHVPPRRPGGPLRVGLVWGGAPRPENLAANAIDRRRSIGLAALAPLAELPGLALVSLQLGPYAAELTDPPEDLRIFDPTDFIENTDDTASLIRSLDLVVSVDTSVAHLAAGLGQKVILLDRYDNCWRWFSGRTDSPWYPGLEIIRQTRPGDWAGVVERLCDRLRMLASHQS
ncbi:tetratricopeptide repeat-containing glycosyltransferase family protein [Acetobacteraceae bacterium KSS8]|uniref:Tetratricopeptide repeat-containing glycosyltransferase family protein n=1 Tax=Endosaccharibacter trunci TaxID=2812733 RepID=A0ABT1WA36_9PROT|nr:tetratricopeptide repeat-containing glycosyltransferase family protein [Acetobacteraceae bacterium KSS8]